MCRLNYSLIYKNLDLTQKILESDKAVFENGMCSWKICYKQAK